MSSSPCSCPIPPTTDYYTLSLHDALPIYPIDGTRLTAFGYNNALAVFAVAERGSMYDPSAVFYMEKMVVGPAAAEYVDLRLPIEQNIKLVAKALDKPDRKSTRLNSSHVAISYAVFCLKKKKTQV